jgi:polyhydroxybutyrate depolymerase
MTGRLSSTPASSLASVLMAGAALLIAARSAPALSPSSPQVERHTVTCDDRSYEYTLSKPKSHDRLPAIMLLHGAGGQGSEMVELWSSLAEHKHVVLIAPQLPRDSSFEQKAPAVFRCVLEDAERSAEIDSERVYLFGYSMGGYLAFDGAMFDSDIFAAAAVYAAVLDPEYYSIVDHAKRKIPIAIFIGDHDRFNSIVRARQTRDFLEKNGFPLHYVELLKQDHSYLPVRDRVNDDAWRFLSAYQLPPGSTSK